MARAAGVIFDWDDLSELSSAVPLIAQIYPNGSGDVNQFHSAGGMGYVIGELLGAGLAHPDMLSPSGAAPSANMRASRGWMVRNWCGAKSARQAMTRCCARSATRSSPMAGCAC